MNRTSSVRFGFPAYPLPGPFTRMFIIWSIFGLVERIMKKTTSLGSESIPNVKNKNFALESFFLMISCKILKRLKNLDLV